MILLRRLSVLKRNTLHNSRKCRFFWSRYTGEEKFKEILSNRFVTSGQFNEENLKEKKYSTYLKAYEPLPLNFSAFKSSSLDKSAFYSQSAFFSSAGKQLIKIWKENLVYFFDNLESGDLAKSTPFVEPTLMKEFVDFNDRFSQSQLMFKLPSSEKK